jgi:hypothetical protein
MIRNLKNSIIFILTIAEMLSIVFISLAVARLVSQTDVKGTFVSVDTDKNTNFGIVLCYSRVDGYVDTLLANGFNDLRIDIQD